MRKVLTIAGSDCSGGAGIQADLKTMSAHRVYGMSVITALTAQNTTGVYGIVECDEGFVKQQIEVVCEDIFPEAVKIGMVSSAKLIGVISQGIKKYNLKNVVVDPVMVATAGSKLLKSEAVQALKNQLIPLAEIITPNLSEAEVLSEMKIESIEDMIKAAKKIREFFRGSILIKGGHLDGNANDLLYVNDEVIWFEGEKIDNPNTHGTGCTLSSAIACNLAEGKTIVESVRSAKEYITGAIKDKMDIGKGRGPLNHCYR